MECVICLRNIAESREVVQIRSCGCQFCQECMQQYVATIIHGGCPEHIPCPSSQCQKKGLISSESVQQLTTPSLWNLYEKKLLEKEVLCDPNRLFCPAVDCGAMCDLRVHRYPPAPGPGSIAPSASLHADAIDHVDGTSVLLAGTSSFNSSLQSPSASTDQPHETKPSRSADRKSRLLPQFRHQKRKFFSALIHQKPLHEKVLGSEGPQLELTVTNSSRPSAPHKRTILHKSMFTAPLSKLSHSLVEPQTAAPAVPRHTLRCPSCGVFFCSYCREVIPVPVLPTSPWPVSGCGEIEEVLLQHHCHHGPASHQEVATRKGQRSASIVSVSLVRKDRRKSHSSTSEREDEARPCSSHSVPPTALSEQQQQQQHTIVLLEEGEPLLFSTRKMDTENAEDTLVAVLPSSSSADRVERTAASHSELPETVKWCPRCRVPIERDDGCAQMYCKNCAHVFCWHCLKSLEGDVFLRHYDRGPCRGALGHSQPRLILHRALVFFMIIGYIFLLCIAAPIFLLIMPCCGVYFLIRFLVRRCCPPSARDSTASFGSNVSASKHHPHYLSPTPSSSAPIPVTRSCHVDDVSSPQGDTGHVADGDIAVSTHIHIPTTPTPTGEPPDQQQEEPGT